MINQFFPSIFNTKIFKFASVGVLATIIHSTSYIIFISFHLHEQFANLIGYLLALLVSYVGHKNWTFSDRKIQDKNKTKFKFVLSSLVSYLLNAVWVYLTVSIFNFGAIFAVIGILAITPIVIYLILNSWVFK